MPGSRIVAGIVFLFGVICVEAVRQTANLRYAETIEFLGSDPMWPRRFVVRLKKSDAPEKFVAALKNTKTISSWITELNEGDMLVAKMPLREGSLGWLLQKRTNLVYLEVNAVFEEFAGHTTIIWKYRLNASSYGEPFKEVPPSKKLFRPQGVREALETSLAILKSFGIIDNQGLLTVRR